MSILNPSTNVNSVLNNHNRLPEEALGYAKHGYYVLPLHTAIFDAAGNCTGCSCSKGKACKGPGKHPRTINGVKNASVDEAQIRRWWQTWPQANIGIDAGKSGLIILDFDTYAGAPSPASIGADENTVIVETASGGLHIWYRQPAGSTLGNDVGSLPAHIDVRGNEGYVVASPSIAARPGAQGRVYTFAAGHKPTDLPIADLPAAILTRLLAKRTEGPQKAEISFTGNHPAKPNLSAWGLSADVRGLIVNSTHKGDRYKGDRSKASMAVCRALLIDGATPDDVRAVFCHYAIGEKYREKKHNGDRWLALTLSRINLTPSPAVDPVDSMVANLLDLLTWVESAGCIEALKRAGFARPADYQKTLIAIVGYANSRRVKRVQLSIRQLALMTTRNKSVISRQLIKLVKLGWLTVANTEDDYARIYDLSPLFTRAQIERSLSGTPSAHSLGGGSAGSGSAALAPSGLPQGGCPTSRSFIAAHLADEAFCSYPHRFAIKLRPGADSCSRGLNSWGLFMAADLNSQGDLSSHQIALQRGCSLATARSILRHMTNLGLLLVEKRGRKNFYSLHPRFADFDEAIDSVRERLPSYGLTERLAAQCAGARADYLAKLLNSRSPLDAGERTKLEARRDKYDALQAAHREAAQAKGLDLSAQLGTPRLPRHRMTIDPIAVFETQHKPLLDAYKRLGTMPHDARIDKLAADALPADCTTEEYAVMDRQMTQRLREAQKAAHQLDLRRQRQLDAANIKPVATIDDGDWIYGPLATAPLAMAAAAD